MQLAEKHHHEVPWTSTAGGRADWVQRVQAQPLETEEQSKQ